MIRGIVAIDNKNGMAKDHGLPWQLPGEAKYFIETIQEGLVLMGYGTYQEVAKPFGHKPNYVATRSQNELRHGFVPVHDARQFLTQSTEDIWNIGGPGLLLETMDLLDEFYITQIDHDFHATKFLPPFKNKFNLIRESAPVNEDGVNYTYQVWQRKTAG